jgi:aminodeoxyfutalosine deaminase
VPRSTTLIHALGLVDALGPAQSPGAILVDSDPALNAGAPRVLALGSPAEIALHPAARSPLTRRLRLPRSVLLPGLVNAHAHLDLTHVGPWAHDPGASFAAWGAKIGPARAKTPEAIRASVERGVELSRAAGVVAIGDIAGMVAGLDFDPVRAVREALTEASRGMQVISFREFFAIGTAEHAGLERLERDLARDAREGPGQASAIKHARVKLGLSPHAPYSVSPRALATALAMLPPEQPVAIHLAESADEHALIAHAQGPTRSFLERIGLWTDQLQSTFGQSRSPIAHVNNALAHLKRSGPTIFVHVNDARTPRDLDTLAELCQRVNGFVAYCPRASDYFHAHEHFGPHQYADMLARNIPVVVGTDSVINLPPAASQHPRDHGQGISVLDELRFLRDRDDADPRMLLAMATATGARALGLDPDHFAFAEGRPIAGIIAVQVIPDDEPAPPVGLPPRSLPAVALLQPGADSLGKVELPLAQ